MNLGGETVSLVLSLLRLSLPRSLWLFAEWISCRQTQWATHRPSSAESVVLLAFQVEIRTVQRSRKNFFVESFREQRQGKPHCWIRGLNFNTIDPMIDANQWLCYWLPCCFLSSYFTFGSLVKLLISRRRETISRNVCLSLDLSLQDFA